jgi:hypothetical protein
MMIIVYERYTSQYGFDVFALRSSVDQANANPAEGVSALQGSTVECAAGDLETRPAECEGEVKSELKVAPDGAVQTIIPEMGAR